MDKGHIDIFLELLNSDGTKVIQGETLDSAFSKNAFKDISTFADSDNAAIEILSFKFSGDSADARNSKRRRVDDAPDTGDDDDDGGGGGGQAGSPAREEKARGPYCKIEITKIIDASSTSLVNAYCKTLSSTTVPYPPAFKKARIVMRKAGGGQQIFLIMTFDEVSVIDYDVDVKSEDAEETLTCKFNKVSMEYYPQAAEGQTGDEPMVPGIWDFREAEAEQS